MRTSLGTSTTLGRNRRPALIVSTALRQSRRRAVAVSLTFLAGLAFAIPVGGCLASNHPLYPDLGSFCTAKAKAICQIADLCAIDPMACQTYQYQQCAVAGQQAASGTRTFSPDNAKTCVDAENAAYMNAQNVGKIPFNQLQGPGSINDKCSRVFTGNAKALSPCMADQDCSGDLACVRAAPGFTTTVCATPTQVAQGDPCQNPGDQCDPDSYCKMQNALWVCSTASGPGEACSDGVPCVSSQHCVAQTCSPRAAAGGSCLTDNDCGSGAPYCDPFDNKHCTIGLTFATSSVDCLGTGGLLPSGGVGNTAGDAGSE